MPMTIRGLAIAAWSACALVFAGAASAQDSAPELLGEPMTGDDLRAFHSGQTLSGCYIGERSDGDLGWRERMAEDGALYDLEKGGAEVGVWWIDEDAVCFHYTDGRGGPYCFVGRRRGPYADFYGRGSNQLVTTTDCGGDAIA